MQNCTIEQKVDFREQHAGKVILEGSWTLERIPQRTCTQIVDVLGKEIVHVMQEFSEVKEQIVEVLVRVVEEIVDTVECSQKERIRNSQEQKCPGMRPEDS